MIEHGYVAHRAGQSLFVLLGPYEVHGFAEGDDEHRATFAALVADRILSGRPPPRRERPSCETTQSCVRSDSTSPFPAMLSPAMSKSR